MNKQFIVVFVCIILGVGYVFLLQKRLIPPEVVRYPVALFPVDTIPVLVASPSAKVTDLAVTAKSVYITDVQSGSVLYKKNELLQRSPASTTKLLTALVVLSEYHLDDTIVVPSLVFDGAKIGLKQGQVFTVEALLQAMLIQSANDAALTLARSYPQGEAVFIDRMNQMAEKIGMTNSHFTNAAGFDDPAQYSTAYDLSLLSREVMKDDFLRAVVGTKELTIADTTQTFHYPLVSTNQLLFENAAVVGIKTGTTEQAGQVLITQYEYPDKKPILAVLMGSDDRFADTAAVVEWVYTQYSWVELDTLLSRLQQSI